MIVYLFLITSVLMYLYLLSGFHYIFKFNRALQVLQQSGYDNKRYFRYFKSGYKDTFPVNELLVLIGTIVAINFDFLIGALFMCFVASLNLRFLNLANSRYNAKKKLAYTSRVKRIIATVGVIQILELLAIVFIFKLNSIYFITIFFIFTIYLNLIIANIINVPIEKAVKRHFMNQAKEKLKSNKDTLVIGVTGSYGKTSIKNIIGETLKVKEPTLITPESFNTPMGLTITINNSLSTFHKNFIAEMGAYYKGEIKELCDLVHPTVGIVSSIGPQHLETFKKMDTIQSTKMELIESLPSNGLAILNLDNEYIRSYNIKNNVKVRWYSTIDQKADIYAYNISYNNAKMTFKFRIDNKEFSVKTSLLGIHNVENILAAILVSEYKGINTDQAIKGIEKLSPIKHRLEYKYINENLSIIDDAFNSNVSGINEALNVLNSCNGEKIIITPGLIDLGSHSTKAHIKIGEKMGNSCDVIAIVANINKDDLIKGIEKTNFNMENLHTFDNFVDAYSNMESIKKKKVILIANDLPDMFR